MKGRLTNRDKCLLAAGYLQRQQITFESSDEIYQTSWVTSGDEGNESGVCTGILSMVSDDKAGR